MASHPRLLIVSSQSNAAVRSLARELAYRLSREEWLVALQAGRPSIITAGRSLEIPGLLERISAWVPNAHIVVVSARVGDQFSGQCLCLGAKAVLDGRLVSPVLADLILMSSREVLYGH